MTSVRIGDPGECLVLDRGGNGDLVATLTVPGLVARVDVEPGYPDGLQDLADVFHAMSADWRGWDGTRSWASVDGVLSLEATHTGAEIRLVVDMRPSPGSGGAWSVRAEVFLPPGEALSRAAAGTRSLV